MIGYHLADGTYHDLLVFMSFFYLIWLYFIEYSQIIAQGLTYFSKLDNLMDVFTLLGYSTYLIMFIYRNGGIFVSADQSTGEDGEEKVHIENQILVPVSLVSIFRGMQTFFK